MRFPPPLVLLSSSLALATLAVRADYANDVEVDIPLQAIFGCIWSAQFMAMLWNSHNSNASVHIGLTILASISQFSLMVVFGMSDDPRFFWCTLLVMAIPSIALISSPIMNQKGLLEFETYESGRFYSTIVLGVLQAVFGALYAFESIHWKIFIVCSPLLLFLSGYVVFSFNQIPFEIILSRRLAGDQIQFRYIFFLACHAWISVVMVFMRVDGVWSVSYVLCALPIVTVLTILGLIAIVWRWKSPCQRTEILSQKSREKVIMIALGLLSLTAVLAFFLLLIDVTSLEWSLLPPILLLEAAQLSLFLSMMGHVSIIVRAFIGTSWLLLTCLVWVLAALIESSNARFIYWLVAASFGCLACLFFTETCRSLMVSVFNQVDRSKGAVLVGTSFTMVQYVLLLIQFISLYETGSALLLWHFAFIPLYAFLIGIIFLLWATSVRSFEKFEGGIFGALHCFMHRIWEWEYSAVREGLLVSLFLTSSLFMAASGYSTFLSIIPIASYSLSIFPAIAWGTLSLVPIAGDLMADGISRSSTPRSFIPRFFFLVYMIAGMLCFIVIFLFSWFLILFGLPWMKIIRKRAENFDTPRRATTIARCVCEQYAEWALWIHDALFGFVYALMFVLVYPIVWFNNNNKGTSKTFKTPTFGVAMLFLLAVLVAIFVAASNAFIWIACIFCPCVFYIVLSGMNSARKMERKHFWMVTYPSSIESPPLIRILYVALSIIEGCQVIAIPLVRSVPWSGHMDTFREFMQWSLLIFNGKHTSFVVMSIGMLIGVCALAIITIVLWRYRPTYTPVDLDLIPQFKQYLNIIAPTKWDDPESESGKTRKTLTFLVYAVMRSLSLPMMVWITQLMMCTSWDESSSVCGTGAENYMLALLSVTFVGIAILSITTALAQKHDAPFLPQPFEMRVSGVYRFGFTILAALLISITSFSSIPSTILSFLAACALLWINIRTPASGGCTLQSFLLSIQSWVIACSITAWVCIRSSSCRDFDCSGNGSFKEDIIMYLVLSIVGTLMLCLAVYILRIKRAGLPSIVKIDIDDRRPAEVAPSSTKERSMIAYSLEKEWGSIVRQSYDFRGSKCVISIRMLKRVLALLLAIDAMMEMDEIKEFSKKVFGNNLLAFLLKKLLQWMYGTAHPALHPPPTPREAADIRAFFSRHIKDIRAWVGRACMRKGTMEDIRHALELVDTLVTNTPFDGQKHVKGLADLRESMLVVLHDVRFEKAVGQSLMEPIEEPSFFVQERPLSVALCSLSFLRFSSFAMSARDLFLSCLPRVLSPFRVDQISLYRVLVECAFILHQKREFDENDVFLTLARQIIRNEEMGVVEHDPLSLGSSFVSSSFSSFSLGCIKHDDMSHLRHLAMTKLPSDVPPMLRHSKNFHVVKFLFISGLADDLLQQSLRGKVPFQSVLMDFLILFVEEDAFACLEDILPAAATIGTLCAMEESRRGGVFRLLCKLHKNYDFIQGNFTRSELELIRKYISDSRQHPSRHPFEILFDILKGEIARTQEILVNQTSHAHSDERRHPMPHVGGIFGRKRSYVREESAWEKRKGGVRDSHDGGVALPVGRRAASPSTEGFFELPAELNAGHWVFHRRFRSNLSDVDSLNEFVQELLPQTPPSRFLVVLGYPKSGKTTLCRGLVAHHRDNPSSAQMNIARTIVVLTAVRMARLIAQSRDDLLDFNDTFVVEYVGNIGPRDIPCGTMEIKEHIAEMIEKFVGCRSFKNCLMTSYKSIPAGHVSLLKSFSARWRPPLKAVPLCIQTKDDGKPQLHNIQAVNTSVLLIELNGTMKDEHSSFIEGWNACFSDSYDMICRTGINVDSKMRDYFLKKFDDVVEEKDTCSSEVVPTLHSDDDGDDKEKEKEKEEVEAEEEVHTNIDEDIHESAKEGDAVKEMDVSGMREREGSDVLDEKVENGGFESSGEKERETKSMEKAEEPELKTDRSEREEISEEAYVASRREAMLRVLQEIVETHSTMPIVLHERARRQRMDVCDDDDGDDDDDDESESSENSESSESSEIDIRRMQGRPPHSTESESTTWDPDSDDADADFRPILPTQSGGRRTHGVVFLVGANLLIHTCGELDIPLSSSDNKDENAMCHAVRTFRQMMELFCAGAEHVLLPQKFVVVVSHDDIIASILDDKETLKHVKSILKWPDGEEMTAGMFGDAIVDLFRQQLHSLESPPDVDVVFKRMSCVNMDAYQDIWNCIDYGRTLFSSFARRRRSYSSASSVESELLW
eukprot:TRINITY_DN740_c0_g1_i2.p1 TRINITY_DN740_c0_g1~~TRINITY_DN740_c0_g1_i2.p1  ORF type:complete len:2228 (-),score=522.27 TRINITY_DN740_c0_g1_i2:1488-8171(-)